MATLDCAIELKKVLGSQLSEKEIDEFLTEVNDSAGENASPMERFEAAQDIVQSKKLERVMRTRAKIMDRVKLQKNVAFMERFKSPVQAIQSLLVGHSSVYRGSMKSVDNLQKFNFVKTVNRIVQELEDSDLLGTFNSREMEREIAQELWALSDPKASENPSGNKRAANIAKVLHKAQRASVERANRAGAWIKDSPGYIVRQSHDPLKLKKAGYATWRAKILPLLDDRTFKGISSDKQESFLLSVYESLKSGLHFQPSGSAKIAKLKNKDNIAASLSKERVLHFKSANAWYDYHTDYGINDLNSAMIRGLKHLIDHTMLMEVLGTNPSSMIESLKDTALKTARNVSNDDKATNGQRAAAERAISKLQSNSIDHQLETVSGFTSTPANPTLAAVSSGARNIVSMASLGKMVLSSIGDIGLQASEARYQGENLFTASFKPLLNLIQGQGNREKQQMARQLGVYAESVLGEIYNRHYVDDGIPGFLARSMRTYFKLNASNWWNDAHRTGFVLAMSNRIADNMSLGYQNMNPETKRVLKLYDIEEAEVSLLQQGAVTEQNGRKIITPDSVQNIPDDAIKAYLNNEQASTAEVNRVRETLQDSLGTMFVSRVDHAHLQPGALEHSILLQGTQAGTIEGEIMRHLTHFKAFPTTMMTKIWTRETMGKVDAGVRNYGLHGLMEGLKDGKGSITGLLSVAMLTTMYGYLAVVAKDIASGKEPSDPNLPETWRNAMVQGGSLGLFGDFIFGEYNRYGRSALASIVGPTFGQVDSIFDIYTRAKNGDPVAAQMFKQIQINTPYQNLFYLEAMLDYMFFYQVQESLNPGFLSRMESRMRTEKNQEFLIPPTSTIPYGGGSQILEGVR